ncbi:MAG TPA: hypothetical protein VMW48_04690, partial [Vicinamibacterales bacterium]|nr:hypothetical protein [Vicinamibacterales bacterium]
MLTRRSFVTLVSGWLAEARSGTRSQAPGSLQGVWSGAVHARGATVKVLTAAPGLPISLTLSSEEAQISDQTAVADADGLAAFVLANLNERSRYRYEVRAPGESPVAGGFRT